MYCDQCEMLAINGVPCHETGCPNSRARWDAASQEWIPQTGCRFIYSRHATRERAEAWLYHLFACGEVSEGERPEVERRGHHWCITLLGG